MIGNMVRVEKGIVDGVVIDGGEEISNKVGKEIENEGEVIEKDWKRIKEEEKIMDLE